MIKAKRGAPVTPAEYQVLSILWELGAGTVAAVHAAFPRGKKVSYNTVLTQVRLLHGKGYLDRERLGRAHVYRPRLGQDETLRRVVRHFVEHFFEGEPSALATFLAESGLLATTSPAERAPAASPRERDGDEAGGDGSPRAVPLRPDGGAARDATAT